MDFTLEQYLIESGIDEQILEKQSVKQVLNKYKKKWNKLSTAQKSLITAGVIGTGALTYKTIKTLKDIPEDIKNIENETELKEKFPCLYESDGIFNNREIISRYDLYGTHEFAHKLYLIGLIIQDTSKMDLLRYNGNICEIYTNKELNDMLMSMYMFRKFNKR